MRENVATRARRLLTEGRVTVQRVDDEAVIAQVRGDAAEVHRVEYRRGDEWTCSCTAGPVPAPLRSYRRRDALRRGHQGRWRMKRDRSRPHTPRPGPTCWYCAKPLAAGDSCTVPDNAYDYGDEPHWEVDDLEPLERCADCGVRLGGRHHDGCDKAVCRVCYDQNLGCDCHYNEDGSLRWTP